MLLKSNPLIHKKKQLIAQRAATAYLFRHLAAFCAIFRVSPSSSVCRAKIARLAERAESPDDHRTEVDP